MHAIYAWRRQRNYSLYPLQCRGMAVNRSLVVELFLALVRNLVVLVSSPGPRLATLVTLTRLDPAKIYWYTPSGPVTLCKCEESPSFVPRPPCPWLSNPSSLGSHPLSLQLPPSLPPSWWRYHRSGQRTHRSGSPRRRLSSFLKDASKGNTSLLSYTVTDMPCTYQEKWLWYSLIMYSDFNSTTIIHNE